VQIGGLAVTKSRASYLGVRWFRP